MSDGDIVLAFTGHRPEKLGGYYDISPMQSKVRAALRSAIARYNPAKAISGMALGVDQWAAEECINLGVPFIAAIPFEGQESRWPPLSQQRFRDLLEAAAEVVLVSPGGYEVSKMHTRNRWMVDACNILVAVWDGSSGGTCNCVRYAETVGRRIHRIDPKELVCT